MFCMFYLLQSGSESQSVSQGSPNPSPEDDGVGYKRPQLISLPTSQSSTNRPTVVPSTLSTSSVLSELQHQSFTAKSLSSETSEFNFGSEHLTSLKLEIERKSGLDLNSKEGSCYLQLSNRRQIRAKPLLWVAEKARRKNRHTNAASSKEQAEWRTTKVRSSWFMEFV